MENINNENSDEILLKFALKDCKINYSYQIKFSFEENDIKFETEKMKNMSENSTLEFSKTLLCKYFFYKVQYIKIVVIKSKINNRANCFNYKIKDDYNLTLSTIISSKNASFKVRVKNDDDYSELLIITAEIQKKENTSNINNYSLFDYISAGISFDSYIGIDFSDKILNTFDMENNQYMRAIRGFRETLFDFVRIFEVYGYGAKLKYENNNKPYFNLSQDENPNLEGFTNIKNAYQECLNQIEYNDNTLSPLLKLIKIRIYEKYNFAKYNIFFLLISNCPKNEDIQNCIDDFIENSFLPLSIVIVGIGSKDNEFKNIQNLYNKNIDSRKGIKKQRDYIYFISMEECNMDSNIFKNKCLKEIRRQMIEYYKLVKTIPEQIKKENFDNMRNSIKNLNINSSLKRNVQNNDDDDNNESAPPLIIPEKKDSEKIVKKNKIDNELFKKDNNNNHHINLKKSLDNKSLSNNNQLNPSCSVITRPKKRRKTEVEINTVKEKKTNQKSIFDNIPESEEKSYTNKPKEDEKKYINTPEGKEGKINNYKNNPFTNQEKNISEKKEEDKKYINTPKYENGNTNNPQNPKKYINTPKDEQGNMNNYQNEEEKKYIITSIGENGGLYNYNKNPYTNDGEIKSDEDKKYVNTPNGENGNINNYNKNPYTNDEEIKSDEDKKYVNTPNGENGNINNYNKNPYTNDEEIKSDEDKKYVNTPNGENGKINNYNKNPYTNDGEIKSDEDKKYVNTPNGENGNINNYNKNPYTNDEEIKSDEDKKYLNTNFLFTLKTSINTPNNLGKEEELDVSNNLNNYNPYLKNKPQNEQLNNNNDNKDKNYLNCNNNNDKNITNISTQESFSLFQHSILNSLQSNMCENENITKESQVDFSSKININDSKNNKNESLLGTPFNNYSIDN